MKEYVGDIWQSGADVICVTTNGVLRKNGDLVMGAGIALEAKKRYPRLPAFLGGCVKRCGNHLYLLNVNMDGSPGPRAICSSAIFDSSSSLTVRFM